MHDGLPITISILNRYFGDQSIRLKQQNGRNAPGISEASTSGLWASTYGFALPYHQSCRGCDCVCDAVAPTQPRTSICSAAGRDKCEDMIASDEEKAPLNHRGTRLRHRRAVKLPPPHLTAIVGSMQAHSVIFINQQTHKVNCTPRVLSGFFFFFY